MSPRPSEEVLSDYYRNSENYAYWARYIFPATEEAREAKIHRPRLEQVLGYCRRFGVARRRLVEVGPGFGTFFALAQQVFEEVCVIEPTPDLAEICVARGADVVAMRVEEASALLSGDVVCAFEVIEHLFDPGAFISACAAMLNPGGLLILTCPNGRGFDIEQLGPLSQAVDNEHLNLFNPSSLSLLLGTAGLKVLEASTPGRLDAELVRSAVLAGEVELRDPFLKRVLIEEWDELGHQFQCFLAENGLSSHMWVVATKVS